MPGVRLDAVGDYLSIASTPGNNFTIQLAWELVGTVASNFNVALTIQGGFNLQMGGHKSGANYLAAFMTDSLNYNGSTVLTTGVILTQTWICSGGNSHTLLTDSTVEVSSTDIGLLGSTGILIGTYNGTSDRINARLVNLKIWSATLTQAEAISELPTLMPRRRANLWAWYPFLMSPNRTLDLSGNGRTLTENGTLTDETTIPRSWGAPSIFAFPSNAGGITYNETFSGSLSSAGALLDTTTKTLTASLTSAGQSVNTTTKVATGSLTPSGVLTVIRSVIVTLSSVLTPTGSLTREINRAFSGALATVGATRQTTIKVLSGALTSSGALSAIRTFVVTLSGVFSSAGTLSRTTAKTMTAAFTPAGSLIKSTRKLLAGVWSSIGAFIGSAATSYPLSVSLTVSANYSTAFSEAAAAITTAEAAAYSTALAQAVDAVTLSDTAHYSVTLTAQ